MTNFQRTAAWLKACGKTPGEANLSVQVGCHIEEFIEFLHTVEIKGKTLPLDLIAAAVHVLDDFAADLKKGDAQIRISEEERAEALDALCDLEVTLNGVAYIAGFDKDSADQAVLASNDAKLVDGKPVIKEGGKIGKPEGWVAPDLAAYV
jgi:predicted HAD superfamily Cof-like phosphohydrolase